MGIINNELHGTDIESLTKRKLFEASLYFNGIKKISNILRNALFKHLHLFNALF